MIPLRAKNTTTTSRRHSHGLFFISFLSSPMFFGIHFTLPMTASAYGRVILFGTGSSRVSIRIAFSIHVVELQLYCTCCIHTIMHTDYTFHLEKYVSVCLSLIKSSKAL